MTIPAPQPAGRTVLIADDDVFEAGYVVSVLQARGVEVLGPFVQAHDTLSALEAPSLRAAVIGHHGEQDAQHRLVTALGHRGVPHLFLARATAAPVPPADKPVLTRPFAAYQVAEWVLTALTVAERAPPEAP